jgi:hypothetical protein
VNEFVACIGASDVWRTGLSSYFLESWPQCEWEFGRFGQVHCRFGIVSLWKETLAVATNFALRIAKCECR